MKRQLLFLLAVAAVPAGASGRVELVPLDVHVGGVTRVVTEGDGPVHEYVWPGVWFEANFAGPSVSFAVEDDHNILNVYVDDKLELVLPRAGRRDVTLTNLGAGEHTVRIEKTTETQGPTARFLGFFVTDADEQRAPPAYARAIEFIGDSFTVGYGNTSTGTACTVTQVSDTTNTSLAFGPLVAKHLNADYRIVASSGFGMVRNYANKEPGTTMPVLYRRAVSEESDREWQPDAIVIWLGTNDFSTELGVNEQWAGTAALHDDYRTTYIAFVESLRRASPQADILLVGSGRFVDDVRAVHARLAKRAGKGVAMLVIDGLDYQGCHGHPSVADHEAIATRVIEALSALSAATPD